MGAVKLDDLATLVAAGAALLTSFGVPATYLQARSAHAAAEKAVEAAQIGARALHADARRTAQREAFISLLTAVDVFGRTATHRYILPIASDISNTDLEESTVAMFEAFDELTKAVALVNLDAPEVLLPTVQRLRDHAGSLTCACQTDDSDHDDEALWWVAGEHGDEEVPTDTVIELFNSAHQEFVKEVRHYLNADTAGGTSD
ncbi:hypothetical protein [Streptomyces sp. NPDC051776]|uniref:hypothetical protein n=1 Tax=Streptomyces sp. NPDC051776 TaxID=3155414 RepID=UPI003424618B